MLTQSAYTVVGITASITAVVIGFVAVFAPTQAAATGTSLIGFMSLVVLGILQVMQTKKVVEDMGALEKNMNSKMDKHIEEIRAAATAKGVLEGRRQVESEAANG